MMPLNEEACRKGEPLRKLWTADEARDVKRFINNLKVVEWDKPYTEVDPDDATIFIPKNPDTLPPLYVAVSDAFEGIEEATYEDGEQDPNREYIELRRINADGTIVVEDQAGNPIDAKIYQVMAEVVPLEEEE